MSEEINLEGSTVCPSQINIQGIEALWWTLHHSEDEQRMISIIECFLDESGTDDLSPTAVVGGIVIQRRECFWLTQRWAEALAKHHIQSPIHMKEFGVDGKLGYLDSEERRALFIDLVRIINDNKYISVAATLTTAEYDEHFRGVFDKKKVMGVYGICFLLFVAMQGKYLQAAKYRDNVPFVLDYGNPYRHHVLDAHAAIVSKLQKDQPMNVGSLAFATDDSTCALQVADIIAWGARRKLTSALKSGFEPITEIFDVDHVEESVHAQWMINIGELYR